MPSVLTLIRLLATGAALSVTMLAVGCGGKGEGGNRTEVQMKDLETVDGTINDAMTDLDGVQSEGTAMAETGNNAAAMKPARKDESPSENRTSEADTEVVADQ